ncbi:MAG: ferredoxin [Thermoleophilaceae bacterium]
MSYRIEIDEAACAAHGDCEHVAPEVFRVDDVAVVIGTAPPDRLVDAAASCPSTAIALIDEESGRQVYP